MLRVSDCKYIISEIRNRSYYSAKVDELNRRLEELDQELISSSGPYSPNAGMDVIITNRNGDVIIVNEKIRGHGKTTEQKILEIIEKKDSVERDRNRFLERWNYAENYYKNLLADREWHDFVEAFFGSTQYDELSIMYAVGNPHRQMCQIIMNDITRV